MKKDIRPRKSPKLTFIKLTATKETITKEELLQQIPEKEKIGFSIKEIILYDTSFAAIDKMRLSLRIEKAGTFKMTLILKKSGFQNVAVEAVIESRIKI